MNSNDTAHRYTMKELFSMDYYWRIPIYQRHYSWDSKETGQVSLFWETVEKQAKIKLEGKELAPHYLGAILVKVNEQYSNSRLDAPRYFDVVDGQQRLTTTQLALLALIASVSDDKHLFEMALHELGKYVFVDDEHRKPRLEPYNYDNKQYRRVVFGVTGDLVDLKKIAGRDDASAESKVFATFEFFQDKYTKFINTFTNNHDGNKTTVFNALRDTLLHGIDVVLIPLRKTDKAQEVFETLNTAGKELTTLDLIRNNVFQRAADSHPNADQKIFDSNEWQTFEDRFWETVPEKRRDETHVEIYIPRMMMAKLPNETIKFRRNLVVKTYREKFAPKFGHTDILAEVRELIDYTGIYRDLTERARRYVLPTIDAGKVKSFGIFSREVWGNRDFWPFIFLILKSEISITEQQRMLRLLESFVVRRYASDLTTENYNLLVADMCKLADNISYSSLKKFILRQDADARRFPDDAEINADYSSNNFFGKGNKRKGSNYILQIIARDMEPANPESTPINELTIDHILPQSWHTNSKWQKQLLPEGGDILHNENAREVNGLLHTIGNLTLLTGENNSAKSNRHWDETHILLHNSPLAMNSELAKHEVWNAQAILKRGAKLVNCIRRIWPHPDDDPI